MNIYDGIREIIEKEDVKNPLTDEEIAEKFNITRENITTIRRKLDIKDSRQRRKPYLIKDIVNILNTHGNISTNRLTSVLNEYGYAVSRNIVKLVREEAEMKISENSKLEKTDKDAFSSLIGSGRSLKPCILQAKAAILYPPFGLPTLIVGESGVGKTNFVKSMYSFAVDKGILSKNSPFVIFNCADYSDNPQLLLSALFGHKKGSFTGADKESKGVVEEANNGILFLDEIHRLPPKGQEILFSILDYGKFRKLGETTMDTKVKIMLIGATTEDIESSFLLSFRRRIPMLISLPSLKQKDVYEKLELIRFFFQQECNRISKKMLVSSQILKSLILSSYPGNIGQLKSSIQVICARAFVKEINRESDITTITIQDSNLSNMDNFYIEEHSQEIKFLNSSLRNLLFIPYDKVDVSMYDEGEYSLPATIYDEIKEQCDLLNKSQLNKNEIEEKLWAFVVSKFDEIKFSYNTAYSNDYINSLKSLVRNEIIEAILKTEEEIRRVMPKVKINYNILLHLGIHLEEAVRRINNNNQIINFNIDRIEKDYPLEYKIAQFCVNTLKNLLGIIISRDEVGFIAMYIKTAIENKNNDNPIPIIIMAHGKVASEIVNVVNKLISNCNVFSVNMPLDQNPSAAYNNVLNLCNNIDHDKGILFLADMGSLVHFGDYIAKELNIETRTIDRFDMLTAIEASRKSLLKEYDLNKLYYSLIRSKIDYPSVYYSDNDKEKVIIALCITGKGLAIRVKDVIAKRYGNIKIITLGIVDEKFELKIKKLKEDYNVIAAIGTINPEIEGINFIPFKEEVFENLDRIIVNRLYKEKEYTLQDIVNKDMIFMDLDINDKDKVIDFMVSVLVNEGYVSEGFLNSVKDRENDLSTFFKNNIAIPHGMPTFVKRPAIVFAKLKNSIDWGIGSVKIICLLALRYSDKQIFSKVSKRLRNKQICEQLKESDSNESFYRILLTDMEGHCNE